MVGRAVQRVGFRCPFTFFRSFLHLPPVTHPCPISWLFSRNSSPWKVSEIRKILFAKVMCLLLFFFFWYIFHSLCVKKKKNICCYWIFVFRSTFNLFAYNRFFRRNIYIKISYKTFRIMQLHDKLRSTIHVEKMYCVLSCRFIDRTQLHIRNRKYIDLFSSCIRIPSSKRYIFSDTVWF